MVCDTTDSRTQHYSWHQSFFFAVIPAHNVNKTSRDGPCLIHTIKHICDGLACKPQKCFVGRMTLRRVNSSLNNCAVKLMRDIGLARRVQMLGMKLRAKMSCSKLLTLFFTNSCISGNTISVMCWLRVSTHLSLIKAMHLHYEALYKCCFLLDYNGECCRHLNEEPSRLVTLRKE